MDDQLIFQFLTFFFSGILIGAVIFWIHQFFFRKYRDQKLEKSAQRILNKAQSEAYRIEKKSQLDMKNWELQKKQKIKKEIDEEKQKLQTEVEKFQEKQSNLEAECLREKENLESVKTDLEKQQEEMQRQSKRLDDLQNQKKEKLAELNQRLENVGSMTQEQAVAELKQALEEEVRTQMALKLKAIEEDLHKKSEEKSKYILAEAMARKASSVTTERTVDLIPISKDEIKGKVIGREGRNIRALEYACGVDVLIEEGQDSIIISCFDAVRRAVAKTTITRLIEDGRIHPSRIEETVEKVKSEIFQSMKEEGEKTCFELNVHNVHPKLIKVLGGLKFKVIRGMNALSASVDLAGLASDIMAEIGAGHSLREKAKRAALFHCIGLNIDHKVDGNYAEVGADFAQKHREKPDIVQAILSHNSHKEAQSLLDHIVQSAFNLYRSLPKSKQTNIESFINRMKNIESIANSFAGVIRSYAVRSGKEIRVLVNSSQVTDTQTAVLCSDIAKKLERELDPSHQIKVHVVRESRIIEHAR